MPGNVGELRFGVDKPLLGMVLVGLSTCAGSGLAPTQAFGCCMGAPASEVGVDPDVRDAGLTANARRSRVLRWADSLGLAPTSLGRTWMRAHKKTGRLATTGLIDASVGPGPTAGCLCASTQPGG